MPWMIPAAIAGSSLIGSYMSGQAAESAANTSANAQLAAAQIAAEEARFRPVGISTRFGTSQFQFGPEGRLSGASYTASPEIRALQDRLSAMYGSSLGMAEQAPQMAAPLFAGGQGLFNLAQQYLATSPDAARQQYMQEQQALLEPSRMREEARLGSSVFGRGRAGLNVGASGQPELFALAQARREQDLGLAARAEQAAQQRAQFGAGLFGTGAGLIGTGYDLQTKALSPFQTQFGLSQLLEQAAQQPLDIGAQLGGRSATAGSSVGQMLLQGGLGAAQTQLQGSLVGPSLMASNISNIGQQYLQNQQQQNMFNQLMGYRNAQGFGYRPGTSPMSAGAAADWWGGSSASPYDPSLFQNVAY